MMLILDICNFFYQKVVEKNGVCEFIIRSGEKTYKNTVYQADILEKLIIIFSRASF